MWILTLIYNEEEFSRPLRRNSVLKIGRNNDYKNQEDCLHIGDLKVPKKYITVNVGSQEMKSLERSPLSVTFESICTTKVNEEVFKLQSREADPFTKEFSETDLLLKVNANKSDRIKIRLRWVDVVVLAFSKKMMYEGECIESHLPALIKEIYESGIDIRATSDPLKATHYLTAVDNHDYNLQIALSRAIPVVSEVWALAMRDEQGKVEEWLLHLDQRYLYEKSEGNYVFPDSRRRTLLSSVNAIVCYHTLNKQTTRLEEWLKCLGCAPQMLQVPNEEEAELTLQQTTNVQIFVPNDDRLSFLQDRANTTEALWTAMVNVDASILKVFEASVKREPESIDLRPTQRKRRKVKKVGDTDFFQFSQASSIPIPEEHVEQSHTVEEVQPAGKSLQSTNEVQQEKGETQREKGDIDSSNTSASNESGDAGDQSHEVSKTSTLAEDTTFPTEELHKRPLEEPSSNEPKRTKVEPTRERRKIIPLVSLADAVRSTKKQADYVVKEELGLDEASINESLDNLAIVEEIDLSVRRVKGKPAPVIDYKGRKNFKSFKKSTSVPKSITRTFIQLENQDNSIHFEGLAAPKKKRDIYPVKVDFDKEMGGVKGFQPEESQLFVGEESEIETEDDGFSFSTGPKPSATADILVDESDDDDDVTFAFSRR
ncbi:hypothetical protein ACI3L0_000348 [Candidozyma auris]|uniref:Uncharacterized protein n=1 Tax=Candidozyma auris TaxID=498019 RepID=A0A2H1A1V7_CANAR|nr:hypothetical protein B9J08_001119 [[Candida] auris]